MSRILEKINSPQDLKNLKLTELKKLAQEIREVIIETVARNGGHLAPNLGVVELTLALHYVFESPKDRIVWDVGHQSYAHKLLTSRRSRFHTLRQYGGVAGFPKRAESPHDIVETGHSSTSLSYSLGIATALRLSQKEGRVIAVIGDGSMTAGLAFEALNHTGHLKEDLIVILNDNEMSISPNVGALSSFLSRRITGRLARRLKKDVEKVMGRLPGGEHFLHALKKSEEILKCALTPGMLFEALNFEYIGPVDGHDLEGLIQLFRNLREMRGPLLVHVLTQKGKGYRPAEDDPETFHGVGPFDPQTGRVFKDPKAPPTYTEVFGQALIKLAEEEPRLVAITAAMASGTGLKPFSRKFPHRFFDVGICEQHAVTFAAGLALEGLLPVCAIYSTFLQRAFDQLIHDVALPNLHVVFALDRGGLVGEDGPTHQGQFDLSYLRLIPNFTVMAPKDENELQHLLYTALKLSGPAALRYPRGNGVGAPLDSEFQEIPLGKAEILREGKDLLVLAAGPLVYEALKAAETLEKQGVSVAVVNARFIKPLDEELICELSSQFPKVVTLEENTLWGGFGSAVAELLSDRRIPTPLLRIGLPDRFIEHGSPAILREKYGLLAEKLAPRFLAFLETAEKPFSP